MLSMCRRIELPRQSPVFSHRSTRRTPDVRLCTVGCAVFVSGLLLGGELLATPLPDVVLYGTADQEGAFPGSATIEGTAGGHVFTATFESEAGTDYYLMRIPADNTVGNAPRPGAVVLDGDPEDRTLVITVDGVPVEESPIVLTEPGIMRLDIVVSCAAYVYGDVTDLGCSLCPPTPCTDLSGCGMLIGLPDIVYVLDAFGQGDNWEECYPNADLRAVVGDLCAPDGSIALPDLLAVLQAFRQNHLCASACPCP